MHVEQSHNMKVAFVGKGGSGKTTLAALLARHLVRSGAPVLAIDADINQHLAGALGMSDDEAAAIPAMGAHLALIKDYLRGGNPRIHSSASMVKTTPPGSGSRLVRVTESNPIYQRLGRHVAGLRLLATGPFNDDDLGVSCYHSKVGAAELLLNHMVDGPGEYVVVDMTAGADAFASGMFTRFDLMLLVAEPTLRSVSVLRQYQHYARDHDVAIAVVGNKVPGAEDVDFLREQAGDSLLTWLGNSSMVRAMEKGRPTSLDDLEPENLAALARIRAAIDARPKQWEKFHRQTVEFHLRNATAWASSSVGEDLAAQVDPTFSMASAPAGAGEPVGDPVTAHSR
jgi:CO dehydrogenase maturation factor